VRVSPLAIVTKPVDADADSTAMVVLKLAILLEAEVETVLTVSDIAARPVVPKVDKAARLLWDESSMVDNEAVLIDAVEARFEIALFAESMLVESDVMLEDSEDCPVDTDATAIGIAMSWLLAVESAVDTDARPVELDVDSVLTFAATDENAVDAEVDSEF
jgi:hypothetical protein